MLIVSITALEELERVGRLADAVELRLDCFDEEELSRLDKVCLRKPCIFTFRKKEQGGSRVLAENERLRLIEKFLALTPDYFDLEADTDPAFVARMAQRFPRVKFIGSYHNFDETPGDLDAIVQRMQNPHFAFYKIAVKANSTIDMLRLMLFAREHCAKIPLCCISMGEFGKPSRVLGKVMGNALDYAGLEEETSELFRYCLKTLHDVFHYYKLNQETKIYALIGNPVEQSPAHLFHNERFADQNAVYIKMCVKSSELAEFFALCRKLPFAGFSVTIPLKEEALAFMDQVDPDAAAIGALNTVVVRNGVYRGLNTDAPGALDAIERRMKVQGKRVAILGAGGTAKAIAFEAKRRGATVLIFNRTASRAHEFAQRLGCAGYGLEEFSEHACEVLVNTTPPGSDLGLAKLRFPPLVMDVVYTPRETSLLRAAHTAGSQCIYGEEMLEGQAVLQQLVWKNQL